MTSVSEGETVAEGASSSNVEHPAFYPPHINSAATPATEEEEVLVSVFR